jgi:hypothetical protein
MIVREEELHDRVAIHDVVRAPPFGQAAEALLVDQLRVDGDSVVINGSVRDTARHENGVSGWRHSRRIYSTDYFISR